MDEPAEPIGPAGNAAAGAEHLQAAGREFLAAARSLLDAVEEVVEDRTRLGELAESFTGFLGELAESARGDRTPWGRAVRVTDPTPSGAPVSEEHVSDERVSDERVSDAADGAAARDEVPPGTERPRSGRVRRIPLD